MKISKIEIEKFRGFENEEFELGDHLTIITGQNGTQKTTVLGMLSQPFSLGYNDYIMKDEKPLCGGSFRSAFSDKFKFSKEFDKAGEHEWTLFFNNEETPPYTAHSIPRDKQKETIRFWRKGNKSRGSGYIQHPVIYLSLKRLYPIGEDNGIRVDESINLSDDDLKFYREWHNKILILTRDRDKVKTTDYLLSSHKQTLGANTNHYDWKTNSAGQDNISKILLAIMSFKRLKEKYGDDYKGGLLAIDEIDATFYSGSQIKLLQALTKFASNYNIQIIITTHSLTLIKEASKLRNNAVRKKQIRVMFLKKVDGRVRIEKNIDYDYVKNHLNKTLSPEIKIKKIMIFTEDKEGLILAKSLLGAKKKYCNFVDITLGCSNLIQLASIKVPSFTFPNSLIMLDGDVKADKKQYNRVKKIENIILLPTEQSPEQLISQYLNDLSDEHPLWSEVNRNFDHTYCYQEYSNEEIQTDRIIAKKWFKSHLNIWGINASKVLNHWKNENPEHVNEFNSNFDKLYNKFAGETIL